MALNNSFVKLDGTLDGLTFYQQNGKNFVKTKAKVSKARYLNDQNYRRVRENNMEFGGSALVGKSFRSSFAGLTKLMGDSYLTSRLVREIRKINSFGLGARGERSFDMVANGDNLNGFEFNPITPFSSQFYAPFIPPTINPTRDGVTWTVPDFVIEYYINQPYGSTHFKLVLAMGYVSDYTYSSTLEQYLPVNEKIDAIGSFEYSDAIPLKDAVGADTILSVNMDRLGTIPETSAVFAAIGIVFYQEVNGQLYELAQGNAMKIADNG